MCTIQYKSWADIHSARTRPTPVPGWTPQMSNRVCHTKWYTWNFKPQLKKNLNAYIPDDHELLYDGFADCNIRMYHHVPIFFRSVYRIIQGHTPTRITHMILLIDHLGIRCSPKPKARETYPAQPTWCAPRYADLTTWKIRQPIIEGIPWKCVEVSDQSGLVKNPFSGSRKSAHTQAIFFCLLLVENR